MVPIFIALEIERTVCGFLTPIAKPWRSDRPTQRRPADRDAHASTSSRLSPLRHGRKHGQGRRGELPYRVIAFHPISPPTRPRRSGCPSFGANALRFSIRS